jgi:hypothetical protein
MKHSFKNSILVVVFNYSNCINNKQFLNDLYAKHFKKILFYSDLPCDMKDKTIHYIDIAQGYYTQGVFVHLYKNYSDLIHQSDGVFYTMDDNIINTNILHLYDNSKVLYYYNDAKTLDNYSGWQWDTHSGKNAIYRLLQDDRFKQFAIDKFAGCFSDWFYLPKKYWNETTIQLFDLFYKHKVFLEIAIPTVIYNIEHDKSNYAHNFTDCVKWGSDRNVMHNKHFLYNSFNHHHDLIVHPIKFNLNSSSMNVLKEILCKKRCVVITTINKPTESILKHINNESYDVIIVGDTKTPNDYNDLNCIFLDINSQKKLFPILCNVLPYNHYSRKNLGYLYAIKKGYDIIYETDDDNLPFDNFDNVLNFDNLSMITETQNRWINVFKYFTDNSHIWPRGFPLSLVKQNTNYSIRATTCVPSIINGLVENDPDVDALFRLTVNSSDISWSKNCKILIDNNNVCVFNTQNTFWTDPELFISLYIPCSVSFRYCDILRGIISNILLKKLNKHMMYSSPNVTQHRNQHNLIHDFQSEFEMYIHNETILEYIEHNTDNVFVIRDLLVTVYNNLLEHNVIKNSEFDIFMKWLDYF